MGLRTGQLVCDACWSTLFSFASFQTAVAAKDSNDRFAGLSYTTQTWKEIEDGENAGCNWCDFLWGDILEYRRCNRNQSLRTKELPPADARWKVTVGFGKDYLTLKLVIDGEFPTTYSVHAKPDDIAATIVPGRDIIWKVSSRECYNLASKCLNQCTAHQACGKPQPTKLPTRVVDCTNPRRPKLVESRNIQGFYTALSYVWGQEQPHSTCTENIATYLEGIDVVQLPQTIQDAIVCTHDLDIPYLWTDTLCILQDSTEDKNREISQMCDIYRNAYVTIVAASARKADDGFLQNRRATIAIDLPFLLPDGKIGTISVCDSEMAPRKEPINQRAWCFQERLLSPRLLIYASHTLQYQCQAGIKNVGDAHNYSTWEETDDLRLPDIVQSHTPSETLPSRDSWALWRSWRSILIEYTRRQSTNPADRLVALAGIAQYFQRCWGIESQYLAGMWTHSLSHDLLWQRSTDSRTDSLMLRPCVYRAPSWSWAAIDGPIKFRWGQADIVWDLRHWEVTPAVSGLLFGEIKGGKLEVGAILRSVSWETSEESGECLLFERKEREEPQFGAGSYETGEKIGFVTLDSTDVVETVGVAVVVESVPFEQKPFYLIGLLLVPVSTSEQTYRRVGLFDVHRRIVDEGWEEEEPFCDIAHWLETPTQVITIL